MWHSEGREGGEKRVDGWWNRKQIRKIYYLKEKKAIVRKRENTEKSNKRTEKEKIIRK